MATILLDGRKTALFYTTKIQKEVAALSFRKPKLVCIVVGNNPASLTYVRMKQKRCKDVGILSEILHLPENTSEATLLAKIEECNVASNVDGILVQQPLPSHISTEKVIYAVSPDKDVDGFHPLNAGKLMTDDPTGFVPCTPLGIEKLLTHNGIALRGKHVVILGRSSIVGKPLAILLSKKGVDASVTLLHSQSTHIEEHTRRADIVVAAMGRPHAITHTMLKKGAIVVDVGITKTDEGLLGDVSPHGLEAHVGHLSPVPGGVGPMTVAMLLFNTLKSYKRRIHA